jgi:hypothetical protein
MKSKLRKRLKELLREIAVSMDISFSEDPSLVSDAQLVAFRRRVASGQWHFIALSFSSIDDRFFVEVGYSSSDTFPIDRVPLSPYANPSNGALRFRATELWSPSGKSGGWLIQSLENHSSIKSTMLEGVFETPEAAMLDVKMRIEKWILPYLDTANRPK